MTPEQINTVIILIGGLVGSAIFSFWKASQASSKVDRTTADNQERIRQQQNLIISLQGNVKLLEGRLLEQREASNHQMEVLMNRVLILERELAQTQEREKHTATQLAAEQEKSQYLREQLEKLKDKDERQSTNG